MAMSRVWVFGCLVSWDLGSLTSQPEETGWAVVFGLVGDEVATPHFAQHLGGHAVGAGGGSGSAWFKVNADNKLKLKVSDAPVTRLPEK